MAALTTGFSPMLQRRPPEGIQACPALARSEAFTRDSRLLSRTFYADDIVSIGGHHRFSKISLMLRYQLHDRYACTGGVRHYTGKGR